MDKAQSRSVHRRIAAQKGEQPPDFSVGKEAQEIIGNIAILIYFRHTALKVGSTNVKPWHELPLEETQIYWDDARAIFDLLRVKGYRKPLDRPELRERIFATLVDNQRIPLSECGQLADQLLALIEPKGEPPLLSEDDKVMAELWKQAQKETANPMCEYDATEFVMILIAKAQRDSDIKWYKGEQ